MEKLTYQQKYYRANREKRLAESKEHGAKNRDSRREYLKEYYKNNPDKFKLDADQKKEKNRRRRERYANDKEHREAAKKVSRDYGRNNPRGKKAQRLKQYGITIEQFDGMYERCGGKCEICGFADDGNRQFFPFVDHCHTTGEVRGLLCSNCNFGIGKFSDDIERMRAAIDYLQKARADQ